MELRIGGNEVLLSLARSFITEDDAALLLQISKHKPVADYLTKWKPSDCVISQMTVVSVDMIASRLSSVLVDITLVNPRSKERLVQRVRLSDEVRSVVLPVANVGGKDMAVLVERARVAVGGSKQLEALEGVFAKDGSFTGSATAAVSLFAAMGWPLTEKACTSLSIEDIALGADHSPVRVLQATKMFAPDLFAEALAKAQDGELRLVAVELSEVPTATSDMKAAVAASLALQAKK